MDSYLRCKRNLILIALAFIFAACSDSGDSTQSTTTQPTANTRTAFASSGEAVRYTSQAVASIGSASSEATPVAATKAAAQAGNDPSPDDPACTQAGDPYDATNARVLLNTDPGYAEGKVHCALAIDSGSPATIPGSFSLTQGIICMLESQGAINFATNPVEQTLTATFAVPCFPQTFELIGQSATVRFKAHDLLNGANWTQRLELDVTIGAINFKKNLFILNTRDEVGFALVDDLDISTPTDFENLSVLFNRSAGTVRYDLLKVSGNNRWHNRMFVRGEFDETNNAFTLIDEKDVILSFAEGDRLTFVSSTGDNGSGFLHDTYILDDHQSVVKDNELACGAGGNCTGLVPIGFDKNVQGDLDFLAATTMDPARYSKRPLCFAAVTKSRLHLDDCPQDDFALPMAAVFQDFNRVSAFCKDAPILGGRSKVINSLYRIDVAPLSLSTQNIYLDAANEISVTYQFNSGLGPIFFSVVDATVKVIVDGQTLDTRRFVTPANHITSPQPVRVVIPPGTINAASVVELELKGTHAIACDGGLPFDSGSVAVDLNAMYFSALLAI